jgi:hypothetical protein
VGRRRGSGDPSEPGLDRGPLRSSPCVSGRSFSPRFAVVFILWSAFRRWTSSSVRVHLDDRRGTSSRRVLPRRAGQDPPDGQRHLGTAIPARSRRRRNPATTRATTTDTITPNASNHAASLTPPGKDGAGSSDLTGADHSADANAAHLDRLPSQLPAGRTGEPLDHTAPPRALGVTATQEADTVGCNHVVQVQVDQ